MLRQVLKHHVVHEKVLARSRWNTAIVSQEMDVDGRLMVSTLLNGRILSLQERVCQQSADEIAVDGGGEDRRG